MGVLTVLGLQLGLIAFSLGAKAHPEWSVSETEVINEEPQSMELHLAFETGYETSYQAEDPELGLEVKHQDPQDYDITLITHRVRRSEKKRRKKKTRAGTYSSVGSSLSLDGKKTPAREEESAAESLLSQPNPHQGKTSLTGEAGEPEVVRAKRHVENSRKPPKKQPGRYSLVGRVGLPSPNPTRSNNQESQDPANDAVY